MYAKSFIDDMREVAKLFALYTVLFISNDDKAKDPLGLAAPTLQAPLLMHLEYKVKLPDHSFVVATRHKLNPSVYGICDVNLKGEVTYPGGTFIRIRNGKHDKTSAETHTYDMHELFRSERIAPKPILLMEMMVHRMRLPATLTISSCDISIQRAQTRCTFAWNQRFRSVCL